MKPNTIPVAMGAASLNRRDFYFRHVFNHEYLRMVRHYGCLIAEEIELLLGFCQEIGMPPVGAPLAIPNARSCWWLFQERPAEDVAIMRGEGLYLCDCLEWLLYDHIRAKGIIPPISDAFDKESHSIWMLMELAEQAVETG